MTTLSATKAPTPSNSAWLSSACCCRPPLLPMPMGSGPSGFAVLSHKFSQQIRKEESPVLLLRAIFARASSAATCRMTGAAKPNLTLNLGVALRNDNRADRNPMARLVNLRNIADPLPVCGTAGPGLLRYGRLLLQSNTSITLSLALGLLGTHSATAKWPSGVEPACSMFFRLPYQFILLRRRPRHFFNTRRVKSVTRRLLQPLTFPLP